ncbi:MAG: 16S rRNA (cytosine(967)-C(5))-methyltransferase RsmB [Gammaproteobacteria bacterium]|nr:16S rRNA (cytosine(967)-C(5))-methyltransferase RsmB [Gammaproteobacteria bacterium]
MNIRAAAAHVISEVVTQGRSLSDCLPETFTHFPEQRDQALLQAMCYGVCRRYFYLEALLDLLLEKPMKSKDHDIYALMLVGLYQLSDMRIPDYAAVAETVAAVIEFDKVWAKGLVNAVLRNYQRHIDELQVELEKNAEARYSHPAWLIGKIKKAWPANWESVMDANNQHPPFVLRVNQRQGTREHYLEKLAEENIAASPLAETPFGIVLDEAMDVNRLPGFQEGFLSVQDGAAQLAAELLDLSPGMRVLDACAAPGGKTAHMCEQQPDLLELVAVDNDALRLESVLENLERLQLHATCIHSDAGMISEWWDGKLFDRVLLDAPCSASGVIRRHPDIKLLRRPEDLEHLAKEQLRLLTALWPTLKIDGLMLYATCSIFPQENSQVLKQFLAENPDAVEEKITSGWGIDCEIGKQILPGMHGMDGFYYARLRKRQL